MFDEHLNRQHRLSYFVRGPEWGFAVPQGDLAALEDVMRRCSGFWNGVGSLLIPVRADGRIPRWLDACLATHGVERCFMHAALGDRARRRIQDRFSDATRLWDGFDEDEIHPLHLVELPRSDAPKPEMEIPQFRSATLRRIALAVWGDIPDGDLSHWHERYDVSTIDDDAAYGALLRGQVPALGRSPLQFSARAMGLVRQLAPLTGHSFIWLLESGSFDALTLFWNFRARMPPHGRLPPVIGVPRETLRCPDQLDVLADWTPRIPGLRHVPDALVVASQRLDDEVRTALAAVPFVEETETGFREISGRDVEPNDPRTFAFSRGLLGGRFLRGSHANALVSFNGGKAAMALQAPDGFAVRNLAQTRLVFANLPLPLPATASMAKLVNVNAVPADGVTLLTAAMAEWNCDVRLPTAAEALRAWAGDHGFAVAYTQDGRDAEAVLRRLGTLDGLDVLADRKRLALLRALAPASRVKLTRRLVAEAKDAGTVLDEDAVAERLADIGLFLAVEAHTAAGIASAMGTGTRKRDVLALLPPLVSAGFVRRGREVRCPRCRFRMLLDLADQDENVRCRACRETFMLPVLDDSGRQEPELVYRLDGLMARAMDQDVLPVLLTLRAVRPAADLPGLFFAWPGVEFAGHGIQVDIDLLVSDGTNVSCYEVKNNATGLKAPQLRKVMSVAARLGASPGIAAVEGAFAPDLVERVKAASGRVLTQAKLLA